MGWNDKPTEQERAEWNNLKWTTGEIVNLSIDEDIRNADWLKQKKSAKTADPPKAKNPKS